MIRLATEQDVNAIADIYNHYVLNTAASFEEVAVSAVEIGRRLSVVQQAGLPWLIAEADGELLGYAYASKWNPREAYRYTVEVTIYMAPDETGQGAGTGLYQALFAELHKAGYHTAIAVITLPNTASVRIHEKFGMKQSGYFAAVGYKFDRWIDVGYWLGSLQPLQR